MTYLGYSEKVNKNKNNTPCSAFEKYLSFFELKDKEMPVEISLVSEKVPQVEDEDNNETDQANLQLVSPGDVITRFE